MIKLYFSMADGDGISAGCSMRQTLQILAGPFEDQDLGFGVTVNIEGTWTDSTICGKNWTCTDMYKLGI